MYDECERIDFFGVYQYIDLDHIGGAVFFELIIHRRVAARGGFELVKKVHHHFGHRNIVSEFDLTAVVVHGDLHAAFLRAQGHHATNVFRGHE